MESLLIIGTHYRIEMSKIHSSYRAILTMKLQERYFPLLTDESVVAQYSKVLCLGPNAGKCCTRDRSLCVSAVPGSVLRHGARGWRVTVPLCRPWANTYNTITLSGIGFCLEMILRASGQFWKLRRLISLSTPS